MGSSKKHKEKDKDRERKHKHKDRDRDREKERKHRSKHRHKDRHSSKEAKETKDFEAGEISSPEQKLDRKRRRSPSPPQIKLEKDSFPGYERPAAYGGGTEESMGGGARGGGGGSSGGGGSGGGESLSISETNKIRAKLGLAPLEMNDGGGGGSGEPGEIVDEQKDVHKPAINISDIKKSEAMKEKMALIREKRLMNKKLRKVKTLADDDSDDDAGAWVERMRKKQIAKAEADKRAKMLEEMDAEFGIGQIVEDEFSKTKKKDVYSGRNLAGLKVEHSMKHFSEGQSVILTLKDMDALKEEEEEVLVNVNMIDDERAKKNVENKKNRPEYKAYQDDDFDDEGEFHAKSLLGKYDEEIIGEQRKSFRLDTGGAATMEDYDPSEQIRNELKQQAVSLEFKAPTLASEYYSPTELECFKKPKKKRRKIKTKSSLADELVPLSEDGRDHGSRGGIRRRRRESDEEEEEGEKPTSTRNGNQQDDMEIDFPDPDEVPIEYGRARDDDDSDIWGQVIEDEAEKELHNVLNKARKLKQKSKRGRRVEQEVAQVVANIKEEPEDEEPMEEPSSSKDANIIFNSTSEFCRTLGDIPSYGKSGLRDEEEEVLDFEKEEGDEEMEGEDGEEAAGAWNAVDLEDMEEIPQKPEEDLGPVLDDEPVLQAGIAGALSLATKKGYLVKESKKDNKGLGTNISAKTFTMEDKNFTDIDSKYNKHDNRYRGPSTDFKEKSDYKPNVNITYTDESGRHLNQKEAFRVLSHRFHGKGSGKMKTEKRIKKVLEEEAMKKMSSTDTPLNTVKRMQEKQKSLQSAYIVLSGGSKTMTAHSVTK